MAFGMGIHDWLSHPSPNSKCSLNLNMKKTILAVVSFLLLLMLGIFEYFFIEKFYLAFPPPILHAVLFILELISLVLFVHALFSENGKFVIPLCVTQALRVILLFGVIIYYIVDIFREESVPLEHRNGNQIRWTSKLLGHLFFAVAGHFFLGYIGWACMKIFSSRHTAHPKEYAHPEGPHKVIVLEKPIEQAMYGKKPEL